ncbi:hypothetical protein KJ656_05005 [bacterium]|nr:hypothetical protein [bacterium]
MKRFAIIFASEEYDEYYSTPYCHSDAKLLNDTLINYFDYAEQDTHLDLLNKNEKTTPKDILDSYSSFK